MMKTGLTLGKFAPLHHGHQYLIDVAVREVDHLIVLIYDAKEVTNVPLTVRANWIRKLYPTVEVIEGKDGPSDVGYTNEVKRIQERYILGVLKGRTITHFYSSERYGDHMSQALGAVNRLVDIERLKFPISGTVLRKDPSKHTAFLDPVVYKDLITNVVFLGAPSTGKTTIAEACARHFNTACMPEYGREYWEKFNDNRRLTAEQLVDLAEGHLLRENKKIMEAKQFLFTDTNAITTFMFSNYYHGNALPALTVLANAAETRYQIFFLCDTDIPYDDTWDRSGEMKRKEFQEQITLDLEKRKIRFKILSGDIAKRLALVEKELREYRRW